MTTLYARLDQAFREAIKNQQPVTAATLRLVKSAIRYREVDARRQLTEVEIQAVINTQVKQRREAMAEYTKAGRPELAQKEEEELSVLLSFLPPQLSRAELDGEIDSVIHELGANGPKDFGKVMKNAMARLTGRADGKVIQEIVRQRLGA
jgi:uncharacterized protein